MSVATEFTTEIARDRAHISALAAFGLKHCGVDLGRYQGEPVDMDRTRFNRERFAFAREIVGTRASDADRGEGRRRLEDGADEAWQKAFDFGRTRTPFSACDDLPFGVVGRAFLTP